MEEILSGPRTNISVKRMGEIDVKVFQQKCKERFSADEADIKALEMCSLWQENMKNSEWHPYKIVAVEGSSERQVLQITLMKFKDPMSCRYLLSSLICIYLCYVIFGMLLK